MFEVRDDDDYGAAAAAADDDESEGLSVNFLQEINIQ